MSPRLWAIVAVLAVTAALPARAGAADGLPSGVPPAALAAEPVLPTPSAWPFPDAFPRTSGTSRLVDGSLQWTDFVYDDRGAAQSDQAPWSFPQRWPETGLAPAAGGYAYPSGANGNGADLFRIGIGLDDEASYWRVDWTTLVDPAVPMAVFTMDTHDESRPRTAAWPAGAQVSSAGYDRALVVSSRGAQLRSSTGKLADLPVTVSGRSFVVTVPRPLMPVDDTWRVRVGSGLAGPDGTTFRAASGTQSPSDTRLYNVGFRSREQEPASNNFWMEHAQAKALRARDVSDFATRVDWDALAARTTTPEPRPTGYSNRWYVSSKPLGAGIATEPVGPGDVQANFLGAIQPYAVYVPTDFADDPRPRPLTWMLHSLSVNHNQYGATAPRFLQQACEARGSICATTLGRGADGWYLDVAELDFWEVWGRLAEAYPLDPERTVLSGYSMGGYGTYRLGMTYPDLFAKAVVMAGPMMCGVRVAGPIAGSPGRNPQCTSDGDTGPLVPNAKWLPYYIAHGSNDELVPVTSVREHVNRFDAAGLRYRFDLLLGEDHMVWGVQDGFSTVAAQMGDRTRERDPGQFSYAFYPHLSPPGDSTGYGPTGAYWIDGLEGRDAAAGRIARVEAASAARPHPAITAQDELPAPVVSWDALPGVTEEQTWRLGVAPDRSPAIRLTLSNVAQAAVDVRGAGLRRYEDGTLTVVTDGATSLRLTRLSPGTEVSLDGRLVATAGASGEVPLALAAGTRTIDIDARMPTSLELATPPTARDTDPFEVTATLTGDGGPVSGQEVTFRGAGIAATAVTDESGVARARLTSDADPGDHPIEATFAGGDDFRPSAATSSLAVLEEVAVLRYTAPTAVRGELVPVAAALAEDDGPALAGRVVSFTVAGRTTSATTGPDGVARALVSVPDHGRSQLVVAKFAGATRLTPATVSATLRWGS